MPISQQQLEQLKCELVGWAFRVQTPQTVTGADQIIRTQIHPELYATAHHMNALLVDGGELLVRRVLFHMPSHGIRETFPQAESIVQEFEQEQDTHNTAVLADCMRELLILTALFDETTLHQLLGSLYALSAHERIQQRYNEMHALHPNGLPIQLFARDYDELQKESEKQLVRDIEPKVTITVPPAVVNVRDGKEYVRYTIPAAVRLFDPIQRHHDIQLEQPLERQVYTIRDRISIPWEQIDDGISLDIVLQGQYGMVHEVHREHISIDVLKQIAKRGSAIPAYIGRNGEIPLYPEYFKLFPFMESTLPQEPLATIRALKNSLDIQKNSSLCELTVTV